MRTAIALVLLSACHVPGPTVAEPGLGLSARVVACEPLRYPAPRGDRPGFVRAASGIAALRGGWVIAQDDLAWIAVRRPDGALDAIPLPPGPDGGRVFEERLGNRDDKPDLEAAVALPDGRGLLFGSGSGPRRTSIAIVDPEASRARLVDATPLYDRLRARLDFAGSELNVEGAAVVGDAIWLFQRGNGAPRGGLEPVSAIAELPLDALLGHLEGGPPPPIRAARTVDLGREGAVPYGFTDAASDGARVWFLAGAEDSPDAVRDGPVRGARIGLVEGGRIVWGPVREADGAPSLRKLEALLVEGDRGWALTDADDPDRPSELCRLALQRG
ncbi:MAG: hypothetical protein VYE22_23830 [Myxococcota bacterium]|nr:hypothetical protein [Myxococcota bacterium]